MISDVLARLKVLTPNQKRRYLITTLVQVLLAGLDLIGVALMGALGAIAIRGMQEKPVGSEAGRLLDLFGIANLDFQSQVIFLGILALVFLTAKSAASLWFTKKIFLFLAECSADISKTLTQKFLHRDISVIQSRNTSDYHHILGAGITNLTIGVLGITSSVIADISLLVVVGIGVFVLDPLIAVTTFLLFGGVGFLLYFGMSKYARRIGRDLFVFSVKSNQAITESIEIYREIYVRNQIDFFSDKISGLKRSYASVLAGQSILPNVSKYVFEIVVIFGALFVSALQFVTQDSSHAIASLVVFLAAGSRIAPALLRVQQNLALLHTNLQSSQVTMEFILDDSNTSIPSSEKRIETRQNEKQALVEISNLTYRYPGASADALSSVNLKIDPGMTVAIVGPSGSGKTTLVDLLLGLLTPNSGFIRIATMPPREFIHNNPGSIGYVPQHVGFIDGTIKENLVIADENFSNDELFSALEKASLSNFAHLGSTGLEYQVGEGGCKLSGGQRQRLGIARALLPKPKLIVLDEATSALDAETEAAISETISNLRGETTLVIIAHRLSTVTNADLVIYVENGEITAKGTFAQVRSMQPNFDEQAALLGL